MSHPRDEQEERRYLGRDLEGNMIHTGDFIGWKEDYEESGKVIGRRGKEFKVEKWDSNTCESSIAWVRMSDAWFEA